MSVKGIPTYCMMLLFILTSTGISQAVHAAHTETSETIGQAVKDALRYYPSIKKAKADQHSAEAILSQAQGEFYPSVDLNYTSGQESYRSPTTFVGGALTGPMGTARLHPVERGLAVRQPLFSGLSSFYLTKQRRSEVDSAAYQVRSEQENIALHAVAAYLQVLQANAFIALGQQNVALHEKIRALIKIQYKGGYGHKADVDLAAARLALAESSLDALEGQKENAVNTYIQIIGHSPSKKLREPNALHYCDGCDIAALREEALRLNPALKSALSNVAAASSAVKIAKSNFYPKANLVYTNTHNDNISGLAGPVLDQKILLAVTYNVLNGGIDNAKKKQAVWQHTSAKEDKEKIELGVLHDLTQAWNNLNIAKSQVKEYKAYVDAMLLTVNGYRAQFKIGARSFFDVLSVEDELYQARQNYIATQYNVWLYNYQILAVIGVLSNGIVS